MNDQLNENTSSEGSDSFGTRVSGLVLSTGRLVHGHLWYIARGISIRDGEWKKVKELSDKSKELIDAFPPIFKQLFSKWDFNVDNRAIIGDKIKLLNQAIEIIDGIPKTEGVYRFGLVDYLSQLAPYIPDIERTVLLGDELDKIKSRISRLGGISENQSINDDIMNEVNSLRYDIKNYIIVARSALSKLRKSR